MANAYRLDTRGDVIRLTKRETEIMNLIAEGNTSKETADALYISKRTVDFHLANVYDKLDVTNRTKALRKLAALDIVVVD